MVDLIDRQAAIEALADYIHNVDKVMGAGNLSCDDCKDAAQSVLEEIPSEEPEIIRCKDCIHNTLPRESGNAMCELYYGMIEPWGFCHRGGRKEG